MITDRESQISKLKMQIRMKHKQTMANKLLPTKFRAFNTVEVNNGTCCSLLSSTFE